MRAARTPTNLTGAAGEYFTAAELSTRGWLATVTIKNAPETDVLAQHAATGRLISVQTKTATGQWFRLGVKDERPSREPNEWFVFVRLLGRDRRPEFFVMPQHHVAAVLYVTRREFSERHEREPAQMSISPAWIADYREQWDFLEAADPMAIPYCGDDSRWELLERLGVSTDHPWHRRLPKRLVTA
ncbi:MAG TPA: hypothetical protein VFL66_08795 [Gaiellaceae bacterium]|nr:hypothetical protein [Gaiellaceae bacterium]